MLTLKLISSFSLLASATILLHLAVKRMAAAYEEGRAIFERIRADEPAAESPLPFIRLLDRPSILFLPLIERLGARNRFGVKNRLAEMNRLLFRAGLRSAVSPQQLLSLALTTSLAGAAVAALIGLTLGLGLPALPVGAAVGLYLPIFTVKNLAATRVSMIEKRLPFAIEFMLLAMEANASFRAAIEEYCRQISGDPLADELRMLLRDLDHGVRLQETLSQLNSRIDSDPLAAFILAVVTGIETGQPMKEVLKVQADAVRQERYKNAEVIAKTASVRALFPVFIVMIAVFLLLIGPMALKIARGGLF
ncbi:MAG TPA: type II secretion system F family protein [Blastocatellia bacterium]|nr:type II secretion system F family protein [Blastocatellia bacterium]